MATQVLAPVATGRRARDAEVTVLNVLAERLAGVDRPRVAVLVDRSPSGAVLAVRRAQPQATVVKIGARGGQSDLHARLAAGGPYDVVLDRTRKPAVRGRRFKCAFFHLVPGGSYIAEGHVQQEATLGNRTRSKTMGAALARIARARAAVTPASGRRRKDNAALADAVESVTPVGDHLVVVNRAKALAKLTEEEANQVLEIRGGPDRVLHTVPGARFASRCTFSSSTGRRPDPMLEVYDAPAASLREYHHAVCVPGQVLTTDHLLLPDTYRHNRQRRLRNSHTEELGRRFAALDSDVDGARLLEGTYFYLDNEIRGHFGHAMTEQLSRLWALPLARELAPDLKAVLCINRRRKLEPFEIELYGAAGLVPEELVLLRKPRRVERLLSATPMFSMPAYVHPEIQHTWRKVGDTLAARATMRPDMDRIFISRRIRKRACLNTPEVEEVFVRHGFTILYPEDYPMADQVAIFRRAKVIAGFAGSGLFNTCFTTEPKRVLMLQHGAYTATNEYLIASVLGHELTSIVSDIDRTEDDERGNATRFQSSFTVDFGREGQHLLGVLEAL
ncbi:MAG: glycosyltransferase family 61 protein [Nocardioides sp.]